VKICVLGTHSLVGEGPKVGTQHIAETLARQGHTVTYVTAHASWPMLLSPAHRPKYFSTFHPVRINDRLEQVTPVNFLPVRVAKRLERTPLKQAVIRLNAAVEHSRGRVLEDSDFDLCIFSASSTMTMLPRIRARRLIYRVNDLLSAFEGAPHSLLDLERQVLESHPIDLVCAVNEQIAARLRSRYSHLKVRVVPNGLDLKLFEKAVADSTLGPQRDTNVIYVGWFDTWTDIRLIFETASRLSDHTFHLFGAWNRAQPAKRPANVRIYGAIRHDAIAAKMKACSVGIIPSGSQNAGRLVEKPLKFYEYLAAGLGVAATSYAGAGLEPFAILGDDPETFAAAILGAKQLPSRHAHQIRQALAERDWDDLVRRMLEDLSAVSL
jgi:glycosyltransferase involved in cell wall biosynthesis